MSDTSAFGFGQFVPGFDFLKNLAQASQQASAGATSAMPNMGSWVAPTLSIEELDKRIQELKAVQFWLDQNATALKATIQAMEVQKNDLVDVAGHECEYGRSGQGFYRQRAHCRGGFHSNPGRAQARARSCPSGTRTCRRI